MQANDPRREYEAAKAVLRQTAKPTKYSVRALSLMTPGFGALIVGIK
jgi:preprotein translocase subunit Sss1